MHNKESYENMKILKAVINYDKFKWQICGDLKVIVLLLGLQQGFTKYCCFILFSLVHKYGTLSRTKRRFGTVLNL